MTAWEPFDPSIANRIFITSSSLLRSIRSLSQSAVCQIRGENTVTRVIRKGDLRHSRGDAFGTILQKEAVMPNPDPSSSVQSPARIALSNILYLTDFSEAAEAAFPFATALTRQYGGKLHVLHILTRDAYAVTTPDLAAEVEAGQKQYADSQMRKMAARMQGLPHETKVEAGVAFWQGLERELKRTHIDLIVVGTHGRQGIRKMLLGSTAEEVFRGARVPVLTIGPGCGSAK